MSSRVVAVLANLLFLPVAGVVFGWFGAIVLLGIAFALVAICGGRVDVATKRWLYALAGVAAGALHLALGYLSILIGFPVALDLALGLWIAKMAFTNGPLAVVLAPFLAGALAGSFYAAAAGVGLRRQPS